MKRNIYNIIISLFTIGAFFLNQEAIFKNTIEGMNIFESNWLVVSIVFLLIIAFYHKYNNQKTSLTQKVLAGFFALCCLIGNSYLKIGSWDLIFGNYLTLLLSIISGIGYYVFFKSSFSLLTNFINKIKLKDIKLPNNKYLKKLLNSFEKHPFLTSLIIILLAWLIYVIAFYPIILSPDPSFQIKQYFNEHTKYIDWVVQLNPNVNMTTHHPVIHTILLGGCIEVGRFLINDNFGLFLYSLIQTISLASVLAYTISFCKRYQVKSRSRLVLLLIYSLVPVFPLYAMSGVKDTFYTIFMILYTLFIFEIVSNKAKEKISWTKSIYLFFVLLLLALFRNNGLYVIILSLPFLIIFSKPNRIKLTLILFMFLASYTCIDKVVIPAFGISGGSIREVLSIPFQQTARYTKYHSKDLSKEDIKVIDNIIGYDDLAERYDPEKADPVKNMYNKNTTKNELKDYFKVWGSGLLKHPTTYIEATLNNTYGYFYPNSSKWYVYYKYDTRITENNLVDYHYNSLNGLRNVLSSYGVSFPYIPVIGSIVNVGLNTWFIFILGSYLIDINKKKYLIVLSPLLVSILVCIASPVNTYFRYTMPYIFVIPTLVSLLLPIIKTKNNKKG